MMKRVLLIVWLLSLCQACRKEETARLAPSGPGLSFVQSPSALSAGVLAEGSTVRIVAYPAGASVTASAPVAEGTYRVVSSALTPCVTDDNGTVTGTAATDMLLVGGNYDFYAWSPAVKASGAGAVPVAHGTDLVAAAIGAKPVSGGAVRIELPPFDHKTAQVRFTITRYPDDAYTTDIALGEGGVKLNAMSASPAVYAVGGEVAVGAQTGSHTLPKGNFVRMDAYTLEGGDEVLPRAEGKFTVDFDLVVNGAAKKLSAEVPALALEAGKSYAFRAVLEQNRVRVFLTSVSDWEEASWEDPDIGKEGRADYTDNGQPWFWHTQYDIQYNGQTGMNWYAASGRTSSEDGPPIGPGTDGSLCPPGWRMPTLEEGMLLFVYNGANVWGLGSGPYWTGTEGVNWSAAYQYTVNIGYVSAVWKTWEGNPRLRCVKSNEGTGRKYPYVKDGKYIVSRDAGGGVLDKVLHTSWTVTPEHLETDRRVNRVPAVFEVYAEDTDGTSGNGSGIATPDASKCPAGWRMPTHSEIVLMTVLRDQLTGVTALDNTCNYWSTTGFTNSQGQVRYWQVRMNATERVAASPVTGAKGRIRCVRDAEREPLDYTDNGSPWFRIAFLEPVVKKTWWEATGRVSADSDVPAGTGTDGSICPAGWRLPYMREMALVYVYAGVPAGTERERNWCSTEVKGQPDSAWTFALGYGTMGVASKSQQHYVRCVQDNSSAGKKYPYVQEGKYIVSRDADGGARESVIHPNWTATPLDIHFGTLWSNNRVSAKFEVAAADVSAAPGPWRRNNGECRAPWRRPTFRELQLMWAVGEQLTGVAPFDEGSAYWSTSQSMLNAGALKKAVTLRWMDGLGKGREKTELMRDRCIRDVE